MGILESVFGGGTGLSAGDRAPPVELEDQSGQTVRLSDFHGQRNVVLFFYPKDDTAGCTREVCAFRDSYEAFRDAGAEVIGISSDSRVSHEGFASKHRLPFKLLSDPGGRVRRSFRVPANLGLIPGRVTYVIDKTGRIAYAFNSQINPAKHVDEALGVLRRLEER